VEFGRAQLSAAGILHYPPYVRPAVFAWFLHPLGLLSYWAAFRVWFVGCYVAYFSSLWLLTEKFNLPSKLLPAFALFVPCIMSPVTGQDSDVMLLLLALAVVLLTRDQDLAAGGVLALCTYKFNLVLLVPIVLIRSRRWTALAAFAGVAALLALASVAIAPPSAYLATLRSVHDLNLLYPFAFGGLRGLLVWIGYHNTFIPFFVVGLGICIYLILRLPLVEGFAVATIGPLLFGLHAIWYDRALLVIPIAVLWNRVGPKTRVLLVAMILYPPAWILGRSLMQVVSEATLLIIFGLLAFKKDPWREERLNTVAA